MSRQLPAGERLGVLLASSKVAHTCQQFSDSRLFPLIIVGAGLLGGRRYGLLLTGITVRRSLGRVGVAMVIFGWQSLADRAVGTKPLVSRQNKELVALGPFTKVATLAIARFSI